jgi:hypothetical protein
MGFTCVSINAMTTLSRAQTSAAQPVDQSGSQVATPTNQPTVGFAMPALSSAPIYYPETGIASSTDKPPGASSTMTQPGVVLVQAAPAVSSPAPPAPAISTPAPVASPSAPSPTTAPSAATSPGSEPAPTEATAAPKARKPAQPLSQYVMEFNRSPVVGNRLRLQGVYPETRLGFSRPRNWKVEDTKVVLRYQHSPALLPDKSRLVVRVNDTSIGSVPLDRKNAQVAEVAFTVPATLLQDENEMSLLAEQQTAETCSNPADPMLWTEILPDSRLLFSYQPQPVKLDFSSYPFPFLDKLSLEPNQLTYLRPKTYSNDWLTATARFQTAATRQLDYRPLRTQLVKDTSGLKRDDHLVVIGTPTEQPLLSSLKLPFPLKNGQLLDGNNNPVPAEVGLLVMTTLKDKGTPVLVATGNSEAGVRQAVQFLVQSRDQQIGTGQALIVDQLREPSTPEERNWPGYLPTANEFQLKSLSLANRQPFQDITVRGTNAPSINIPFHALPDDRFLRGSTMVLHYSYSPQVNPRTSAVEVKMDGVTIGSKRLDSGSGQEETFRLNLPEILIKPDSVLSVNFVMHPKEGGVCGLETDQQLWGTLHSSTNFKLKRDTVVNLPDLKLLKAGYPLAAPQDLSATAVLLPENPNDTEVETLLALSERLGRLSQAESVKYQVYAGNLPNDVRGQQHLVGIGVQQRFPIAEALQDQGFNLAASFSRFWGGSRVHALPDQEGVIKATNSPWNRQRSLLALTAQTEMGLREVQALLRQDSLFSQIRGDTTLISRSQENPSPYDANGYNLQFLQEAPSKRIQQSNSFNQLILLLQDYWFFILVGFLLLALLLYALSQLFLNRVTNPGDPL